MHLQPGLFLGWPAWTLQRGELSLRIVPAVGGRLMGIQYGGTELCFINPDLNGKLASDDSNAWKHLCGDWSFPLWGGGKTWVAPEAAWPDTNPQRDLDSGGYSVLETWLDATSVGIELESPVCRQTGLQIRRRISLQAGTAFWTVQHTLTNTTNAALRCGIWDVLMLRRPGQVEIALKPDRPDLMHNAFRAITGKGDPATLTLQGLIAIDAGQATIRCRRAQQFKLGIAGVTGAIQVQLDLPEGRFQYWRCAPAPLEVEYAHGHPIEVFNAPDLPYFEVESHSPLSTIPPQKSIHFTVIESVSAISGPLGQ